VEKGYLCLGRGKYGKRWEMKGWKGRGWMEGASRFGVGESGRFFGEHHAGKRGLAYLEKGK